MSQAGGPRLRRCAAGSGGVLLRTAACACLLLAACSLGQQSTVGTAKKATLPKCQRCPVDPGIPTSAHPRNQQSTAEGPDVPVPPLLERLFVVISFAWNLQKSVHLEHAINFIIAYPTQVDLTIVSDKPDNVRTLLQGLGITGVGVWDGYRAAKWGNHKYGLLYEHRAVMRNASETGDYTSYVYMEDDTRVPWPALVSWALDTEVLEPLGFLRNFYRTEFRTLDGHLMMFDITVQTHLPTWQGVIQVELPPGVPACTSPAHFRSPEHCVHEHYYQPALPYMGMWLSTHAMLLRFMAHPEYNVFDPVTRFYDHPLGYGVPERSTGMIQVVNPRQNGLVAVVLPYYPCCAVDGPPRLAAVAAIGHSRNGYADKNGTTLGKLVFEEALTYGKARPPPPAKKKKKGDEKEEKKKEKPWPWRSRAMRQA